MLIRQGVLAILIFLVAAIPTSSPANPVQTSFAKKIFRDVLKRPATALEEATVAKDLASGKTKEAVVSRLFSSSERRRMEIQHIVRSLLYRIAGPLDYADGLQFYASGKTQEEILAYVLASPEYVRRAGNHFTGWIHALYGNMLHRRPSAEETSDAYQALDFNSPYGIALELLRGEEFRRMLVTAFYRGYLGRDPDALGLEAWVQEMKLGKSYFDVQVGFVASPEYDKLP